jgi:hypothetical protein
MKLIAIVSTMKSLKLYSSTTAMKNKMKTAVEWLEEQMKTWGDLPRWMRDDIVEKAKAIEKEQIKNSFSKGFSEGVVFGASTQYKYQTSEQYYNETFKSE